MRRAVADSTTSQYHQQELREMQVEYMTGPDVYSASALDSCLKQDVYDAFVRLLSDGGRLFKNERLPV